MADWLSRVRGTTLPRFLDHIWRLGASVSAPTQKDPTISLVCDAPRDALRQSLAGQAPGLASLDTVDASLGPWTARLRGDERLCPHALAVICAALRAHPTASRAYTDTVHLDLSGEPARLDLKPAFDPILDEARPYSNALALHRRGADPEGPVLHIPYPALMQPLQDPPPTQLEEPIRRAQQPLPRVSVVIPSRNAPGLIRTVLAGIYELTDYPDLEVIVSDNGSDDPETLAEYARRESQGLRLVRHEAPFNFAAQVNRGVAVATGDALLLLNNDISMLEPSWLRTMVDCLASPGIGVVGAKLLFPDGTLQHGGVIIGLGRGYAGHWYAGCPAETPGPIERLHHPGRYSAVTAACMLISRTTWDAVDGMDAGTFAVAYNDVDFCLRAGALGFGSAWTPHATLVHHEGATRRLASATDRARFRAEKAALRARHATHRVIDPALSPWLSREMIPRWRRLAELPAARLGWPM